MDRVTDHVARIQAEWQAERPDVDTGPQGVIGRLHRIANQLTGELTLLYAQYGLSEGEFDGVVLTVAAPVALKLTHPAREATRAIVRRSTEPRAVMTGP